MRPFLFYAAALIIVLCDQISKWVVVSRVALNGSRPGIGDFLRITYTENTGGAFSILQAKNSVFVVIAVIAIAALIYAYQRSSHKELMVNAALALALGGAIGNLIDRLRVQHVVDFFDLQFHGRNIWPIFNVADSAITVGIILLAWHFVFKKEPASVEQRIPEESPSIPTPEHLNT